MTTTAVNKDRMASAETIERLLSSTEVGKILGIHPKVVEPMVKRGELPGFKVGKFYRYSAAGINSSFGNAK